MLFGIRRMWSPEGGEHGEGLTSLSGASRGPGRRYATHGLSSLRCPQIGATTKVRAAQLGRRRGRLAVAVAQPSADQLQGTSGPQVRAAESELARFHRTAAAAAGTLYTDGSETQAGTRQVSRAPGLLASLARTGSTAQHHRAFAALPDAFFSAQVLFDRALGFVLGRLVLFFLLDSRRHGLQNHALMQSYCNRKLFWMLFFCMY